MVVRFMIILTLSLICTRSFAVGDAPKKEGKEKGCEVTEETVVLTVSSAPVYEWFSLLEQHGVILSYNATLIDLNKRVAVKTSRMKVKNLLALLLDDYIYQLLPASGRKVIIQIIGRKEVSFTGIVKDGKSLEKLYGASVHLINKDTGKRTGISADEFGFFVLPVVPGSYIIEVSYIGYHTRREEVEVKKDILLSYLLQPDEVLLDEVTIALRKNDQYELDESSSAANLLSFSSADLFSQAKILPGVAGSVLSQEIQVNGGGSDENQVLMDGIRIYHTNHLNTMLSAFNGDAVKNIAFYKSFFPSQFEGRLSSVTDFRLKEGSKSAHHQTISLDMPAASVLLEGPIKKDRVSYMLSGRHSWLDFFNGLLAEEKQVNHSFADYNLKLTYDIKPGQSVQGIVYRSSDEYYAPDTNDDIQAVLSWNNELYAIKYRTVFGKKLSNTNTFAYTRYVNKVYANGYYEDIEEHIQTGIKEFSATSLFEYRLTALFKMNWGVKASFGQFDLIGAYADSPNEKARINQYALFFDNEARLTDRLFMQVGINMVTYAPARSENFYSFQPRFSLKYSLGDRHLMYATFSRMAQFYHYLRIDDITLPTDLRMPSINGFQPRTSNHYEGGWKILLGNGYVDYSLYYKDRANTIALRPGLYPFDNEWSKYIMVGKGRSYGIKLSFLKEWTRFSTQLAYTYSRSQERFDELKERGLIPSLNDMPHLFNGVVSYKLTDNHRISAGGSFRSGRVINNAHDMELWNIDPEMDATFFRVSRYPFNYRLDASYIYTKRFSNGPELLFRFGLYNIIGNPSSEEMIDFYSIDFRKNCLPYGAVTVKF